MRAYDIDSGERMGLVADPEGEFLATALGLREREPVFVVAGRGTPRSLVERLVEACMVVVDDVGVEGTLIVAGDPDEWEEGL